MSIEIDLLKSMVAYWLLRNERNVSPIGLDVHLRNILPVNLWEKEG